MHLIEAARSNPITAAMMTALGTALASGLVWLVVMWNTNLVYAGELAQVVEPLTHALEKNAEATEQQTEVVTQLALSIQVQGQETRVYRLRLRKKENHNNWEDEDERDLIHAEKRLHALEDQLLASVTP